MAEKIVDEHTKPNRMWCMVINDVNKSELHPLTDLYYRISAEKGDKCVECTPEWAEENMGKGRGIEKCIRKRICIEGNDTSEPSYEKIGYINKIFENKSEAEKYICENNFITGKRVVKRNQKYCEITPLVVPNQHARKTEPITMKAIKMVPNNPNKTKETSDTKAIREAIKKSEKLSAIRVQYIDEYEGRTRHNTNESIDEKEKEQQQQQLDDTGNTLSKYDSDGFVNWEKNNKSFTNDDESDKENSEPKVPDEKDQKNQEESVQNIAKLINLGTDNLTNDGKKLLEPSTIEKPTSPAATAAAPLWQGTTGSPTTKTSQSKTPTAAPSNLNELNKIDETPKREVSVPRIALLKSKEADDKNEKEESHESDAPLLKNKSPSHRRDITDNGNDLDNGTTNTNTEKDNELSESDSENSFSSKTSASYTHKSQVAMINSESIRGEPQPGISGMQSHLKKQHVARDDMKKTSKRKSESLAEQKRNDKIRKIDSQLSKKRVHSISSKTANVMKKRTGTTHGPIRQRVLYELKSAKRNENGKFIFKGHEVSAEEMCDKLQEALKRMKARKRQSIFTARNNQLQLLKRQLSQTLSRKLEKLKKQLITEMKLMISNPLPKRIDNIDEEELNEARNIPRVNPSDIMEKKLYAGFEVYCTAINDAFLSTTLEHRCLNAAKALWGKEEILNLGFNNCKIDSNRRLLKESDFEKIHKICRYLNNANYIGNDELTFKDFRLWMSSYIKHHRSRKNKMGSK